MTELLRRAGAGCWGRPARRFTRALDGLAVRPHHKAPTAPTIAMAPKITLMFIIQSLSVLLISQGDGVGEPVHPESTDEQQEGTADQCEQSEPMEEQGESVGVGAP